MAMNPINNTPLQRQGAIDAFNGAQRRDDKNGRNVGEDGALPARAERAADKAEISDTAHRLVELRRTLDEGRLAAASEPDVRQDRIEAVRQRLAQGFYNSVEVQAKVAEGVDQVFRSIDEL